MPSSFSCRQGGRTVASADRPDHRFADPDPFYAPHAFWFWNSPERLTEPSHAAAMAREMSLQGMNPGYVHARYFQPGQPFWLSPDWMASFTQAAEATRQAGTHMTYTMGDPCFPFKYLLPDHPHRPNHPVGGQALPSLPELKSRSLSGSIQQVQGQATIPACFFAVAGRLDDQGQLLSDTLHLIGQGPAFDWRAPDSGTWKVYAFSIYDGVHHGAGMPVNALDRRITLPWLKLEHIPYQQTVAEHFGQTIKGVFFDHEGGYGYKLAWSDDLDADYRKLKGRDIRLTMPLLIDQDAQGQWLKARWDWFDVVGQLYIDCLVTPLEQWCQKHGMYMTCHFWEEKLLAQALLVGNYMAAQRAYSMPGTDALFLEIHQPRLFKETQSVCEFHGRAFMCELLGIAGWHLTPAEMKKAVNSAIHMGLTHLIAHGINTNRNLDKVSYPPDFFDANPYWRHIHLWNDFARRACHVNDHGHLKASVLLLCPIDSVWALAGDGLFDREKSHENEYLIDGKHDADARHFPLIRQIEEAYTQTINHLHQANVSFLIADRHEIESMTVDRNSAGLSHGPFEFKTVILPPLKLLTRATAQKLAEFARAGGRIYALGSLPDASAENGLGDPAMLDWMRQLERSPNFVALTLQEFQAQVDRQAAGLEPCVRLESSGATLLASGRKINGRDFFWLANPREHAQTAVMTIADVDGPASIWNCEDGSQQPIGWEKQADGRASLKLTLEPYQAFWLVFDRTAGAPVPVDPPRPLEPMRTLPNLWQVSINRQDQPNFSQANLPDWPIPESFDGDGQLRSLACWSQWGLRGFSGFVDYQASIDLPEIHGDEQLDLGQVNHLAEVQINQIPVGARLWPPYRFAVGQHLRPGKNVIQIKVGNLILNAITRYDNYRWKWHQPPTEAQLDSGLLGPIRLLRPVSQA